MGDKPGIVIEDQVTFSGGVQETEWCRLHYQELMWAPKNDKQQHHL